MWMDFKEILSGIVKKVGLSSVVFKNISEKSRKKPI